MTLYVVRQTETKAIIALVEASDVDHLAGIVDEFDNPNKCERARLTNVGLTLFGDNEFSQRLSQKLDWGGEALNWRPVVPDGDTFVAGLGLVVRNSLLGRMVGDADQPA